MPIALIELQKRIESLPGVYTRQKDQTTSIVQTEKTIVTRSKSESPRKSRLPDGRERNDWSWKPKIRSGLFNCESIQERKMTWRTA